MVEPVENSHPQQLLNCSFFGRKKGQQRLHVFFNLILAVSKVDSPEVAVRFKHSRPARSSFGASSWTHATRNFALCDPRCRLTIIPGCNSPRRPPRPCSAIRDVNCVRKKGDCVGRNHNRQHHFSAGHLALFQHSTSMSDRRMPKSYLSHHVSEERFFFISRMLILDVISLSKNHSAACFGCACPKLKFWWRPTSLERLQNLYEARRQTSTSRKAVAEHGNEVTLA